MKRLIIIGLLLLGCGTAWCQSADSTGRVLGDNPQVRRSREQNVIGAPIYYDTLGNVIGRSAPVDSFYHRPKHHFRNRLENEYCAFFLEGQTMLSNDLSIGGQFAWVPGRWGAYASGRIGVDEGLLTLGPVWRMSDCGNWLDWQLYGGLTMGHAMSVGAEVGIRMGSPKLWGDFCWTSMSVSVGRIHGMNYYTLGLSLTLTSLVAITIW
jgi:hypothetical protein